MNFYSHTTTQLLSQSLMQAVTRMLSPLIGLNTHINLVHREKHGPKLIVAGAELTGVHVLQGVANKHKPGVHHIGGVGTTLNEVLIKVVSESIERYAQLTAFNTMIFNQRFANYLEMMRSGETVVPLEKLSVFSADQYAAEDFPFEACDAYAPLTWIQAYSLIHQRLIWVPAQCVLVGYAVKSKEGEPWLCAAVTTGTASHRTQRQAMYHALLELIQIDAAMGHWYTDTIARRILMDESISVFAGYIRDIHGTRFPMPEFYDLPSADLTPFNIACVLRNDHAPKVVVGLGADTGLISAMRKAYLEAVGVSSLARLVMLDADIDAQLHLHKRILDLDTNVALYAQGGETKWIKRNFDPKRTVSAQSLSQLSQSSVATDLSLLINAYRASHKELVYLDLTTSEAKRMGLSVARVWSPDTLSLCLPGAAPLSHARFKAYGGVSHDEPHPYP